MNTHDFKHSDFSNETYAAPFDWLTSFRREQEAFMKMRAAWVPPPVSIPDETRLKIAGTVSNRVASIRRRVETDPVKIAQKLLAYSGCRMLFASLAKFANDDEDLKKQFLVRACGTRRTYRLDACFIKIFLGLHAAEARKPFLMLQRYRVIDRVRFKHKKLTVDFDIRVFDAYVYMTYAAEKGIETGFANRCVRRLLENSYTEHPPFRRHLPQAVKCKKCTCSRCLSQSCREWEGDSGNSGRSRFHSVCFDDPLPMKTLRNY